MNPGRLCDVRTYLPDQSEGRSDPGQPALSLATLAGLGLANAACVAGGYLVYLGLFFYQQVNPGIFMNNDGRSRIRLSHGRCSNQDNHYRHY